ncbi:hypothetical protein D3C81_2229590 [compost metagenome]
MVNQEFNITVTNPSGKVVLNQKLTSHPNGFIDLWLPRDNTYQVTVENGGKKAEAKVTTFENNNTCITTMQLG